MSYSAEISCDNYENLIVSGQITGTTFVETIGNFLPMFSLSFTDDDFDKLKYFNELNPLNMVYHIDDVTLGNKFVIKQSVPDITDVSYAMTLGGYLNVFDYLKGTPKVPYVSGTSVEAIQKIASAYFNTVEMSNLKTQDTMNWLHNGMSARGFIQDIWKHMYSPDTLPLIGITLDGKFKVSDIVSLINQEPKFKFANSFEEGYEVYIEAKPLDNSLKNNNLFGYKTEREIMLEDTLEVITSTVKPEVIMTTSDQMNQQEIPTKKLAPMFQPDCVHRHWYEAYHQNIVRWSSLNTTAITWTTHDNPLPLEIMDLIYIELPESEIGNKSYDGNYIVSKKTLNFSEDGDLITTYVGIREVNQNTSKSEESKKGEVTNYRI